MTTPVLRLLCAFAATFAATLARADAELDRRIEKAASSSHYFRAVLRDQVQVVAQNGVVTLRGAVMDLDQKAKAEETAFELPGVVRVENNLAVTAPGRDRADGWLELKIRSILLLRPNVSVRSTHVDVEDGVVTLTGEVDSEAQRELAAVYARNIEGVKEVRNALRVRMQEAPEVDDARETFSSAPGPANPVIGN